MRLIAQGGAFPGTSVVMKCRFYPQILYKERNQVSLKNRRQIHLDIEAETRFLGSGDRDHQLFLIGSQPLRDGDRPQWLKNT